MVLRLSKVLLLLFVIGVTKPVFGAQDYPLGTSSPTPAWFKDAKFGIYIQWGPYSVPSWAPRGAFSEQYQRALIRRKVDGIGAYDGSEIYNYHLQKYGPEKNYYDLGYDFKAVDYDPKQWINLFEESGAKYVVLCAKYQDGFCLWPSNASNTRGFNWNSQEVGSGKDLVGEFVTAIQSSDLKYGLAYSLSEWFHPWIQDEEKYILEYVHPQIQELVNEYSPDILYTQDDDLHTPSIWRSEQLIQGLRKNKESILLNDRWGIGTRMLHGDYFTSDFGLFMDVPEKHWENRRPIAYSMGLNSQEDATDYATLQVLLLNLIHTVSLDGNLVLVIGPDEDGNISPIQQERLLQMGDWLSSYGQSIYGTSSWKTPFQLFEGSPIDFPSNEFIANEFILDITTNSTPGQAGVQSYFTYDGQNLFAFIPKYQEGFFWLTDIESTDSTQITLLNTQQSISWEPSGEDLKLELPGFKTSELDPVAVLKISNVRGYVATPEIHIEYDTKQPTKVTLQSPDSDALIFYTLDGTEPTTTSKLYKRPFIVKKPSLLKVRAFADGKTPSTLLTRSVNPVASLSNVILESEPNIPHKGYSPELLIDRKRGPKQVDSDQWMGFNNKDAEIVIDLGERRKIRKIKVGYMHQPAQAVYAPTEINIEVSDDMFNYKGFQKLNKIQSHADFDTSIGTYETPIYNTDARYIYIHAKNAMRKESSWVFIDEIEIE